MTRYEVWAQGVEIEAKDEAEALRFVNDGAGDVIESLFEYSHTIDNGAKVEKVAS